MRLHSAAAGLVLAIALSSTAAAAPGGESTRSGQLLPEGIRGLLGYPLDYGIGVDPVPYPPRVGGGRNDRTLSALFHNGRGRWRGGFNSWFYRSSPPYLGFGYGLYPGAWGAPYWGYGVPFYPFVSSVDVFSGVGLPYGYLRYAPVRPQPYPLPPPHVIDASQVIINPPPAAVAPPALPDSPAGDRFYLDLRPETRPESLVDSARRQLRVEPAEPGVFLVRWTGPAEGLALVEFQAVGAAGEVLGSRVVKEAPFRGLLRVPEKSTAVLVTLEQRDGSSASIKLPVADFRALSAP